jgi:hypothetical protein
MKTITKTVYTFKELLEYYPKAADLSRTNLIEYATGYDWYEYVFNDWKEKLSAIGFVDANIFFSGFCSQGDGACFTSRVDIELLLEQFDDHRYAWLASSDDFLNHCGGAVEHHGRYYHSNSCRFGVDFHHGGEWLGAVVDEFERDVESLRKDLSNQIYSELSDLWDSITSDESLSEIEDVWLTELGVIENG